MVYKLYIYIIYFFFSSVVNMHLPLPHNGFFMYLYPQKTTFARTGSMACSSALHTQKISPCMITPID